MNFEFKTEIDSDWRLTLDKYFEIVMKLREYTKEKVTYMEGNDYIFTNFRIWYYCDKDHNIMPSIDLYCKTKDLMTKLTKIIKDSIR